MKRLIAILFALLLLTSAACAETWDSLAALAPYYPVGQADGDAFMQKVDVSRTEGKIEISQCELGYDGRSLISRYTIRLLDADAPFGEIDEQTGLRLITWEEAETFDALGYGNGETGFWTDNFWLNGKCTGMAAFSSNYVTGSENPGEIVHTDIWRLDRLGVTLEGDVLVELPIGERPARETYAPRSEHPDKYDADGNMLPPETGTLAATFHAGDGSRARVFNCDAQTALKGFTAHGATVSVTPLMTYIELRFTAADEDEGFSLLAHSQVVNAQGVALYPGETMLEGATRADENGVQTAYFLCPRLADVTGPLYLAPVDRNGAADMTQALMILQ